MDIDLNKYSEKFENIYQALPDNKIFRIHVDSTIRQFKIICRRTDVFEDLRNTFKTDNPGAFFSKQYGYNTQKYLYQISKFGHFHFGLIFEILNWIKNYFGDLSALALSAKCQEFILTVLTPLKNRLINGEFTFHNIADDSGLNDILEKENKPLLIPRDYQQNAIESLILKGYGRGLIEVPTGSGKSFIIANFIWNVLQNVNEKYKFLILVPNTQLVDQFYSDLISYGYKRDFIAKFRGGMKKKEQQENNIYTAQIVISNRQYIFTNKDKLPKFDGLFADEVHTCTAESTKELIENLNCRIKVGCSGTLPENLNSRWNLIGMFGRVVYEEKITNLQDQGYISKLNITLLDILDKEVEGNRNLLFNLNSLHKFKPDQNGNTDVFFNDAYNAELEYYKKNYDKLYEPVLQYLSTLSENIMVLFDRIEIGKCLFELSKTITPNKTSYYIDGSTPVEERENIRQNIEKSGNNILFGNVSVVGTGTNIKRLNHIVFIINTKSQSRILQAIGRTLRLHKFKNEAHLVDVRMNFKYSYKHFNERLRYYKECYGKNKIDEIKNIEI